MGANFFSLITLGLLPKKQFQLLGHLRIGYKQQFFAQKMLKLNISTSVWGFTYSRKEVYPQCALLTCRHATLHSLGESYDIAISRALACSEVKKSRQPVTV